MQKPGETIPAAKASRVTGHTVRKSITLLFDTPVTPTAVEVPLSVLPGLLAQIAHCLQGWPDTAVRGLAQSFAIREVSAKLHGLAATLQYELEMGLIFQQTIDHEEARRLAEELRSVVEFLDSRLPRKQ